MNHRANVRPRPAVPGVLLSLLLASSLAGGGCGETTGSSDAGGSECELNLPSADEEPFDRLREYCFFEGDPSRQHEQTSDRVIRYGVRSKLFSDESRKFRFVALPEGEQIEFNENELWGFPEGTIIVKTFYYPDDERNPEAGRRLLETRLMMKRNGEWEPQIYEWNDQQTGAERFLLGRDVQVDWVDEEGREQSVNYRIPNQNKCKSCHADDNDLTLLGPRTRQLNRDFDYPSGPRNQIEQFAERGMLDSEVGDVSALSALPDPKDESLSIETRARAYLEGNCAHCHNPTGGASNSGLFLGIEQEDRSNFGVCKRTVAAGGGTGGLEFDIKPGFPEESIMIFRMRSTDPEVKMPELPLRTVDEFGVDLLSRWIAQMRPKGCSEGEGG